MTSAQGRLAETIDIFYGAADKASEGAMAAHSYKRAVDDLDTGVGRELVCHPACPPSLLRPHLSIVFAFEQDAPFRTTIMEPLGKMNAYFPVVNEHIAKRSKKVCSLCLFSRVFGV